MDSGYVLQFGVVWASLDLLLAGARTTIVLALVTGLLSCVVGAVCAYVGVAGPRWARHTVDTYVSVVRNTPLLVQIFFLYFGLASIGMRLSSTTAGVLSLSAYGGAYLTEILRAGIEAVPRGQIEAGQSIGLGSGQIFRTIVFRQALEIVYPSIKSQLVLLMLSTSVLSVIATPELAGEANELISRTYRNFEVYIVTTGIYLVLVLAFRMFLSALGMALFPRQRALAFSRSPARSRRIAAELAASS